MKFCGLFRASGKAFGRFRADASRAEKTGDGGFEFYRFDFQKLEQTVSPIQPKEVEQAEYFWYFDSAKAEEELDFAPRDAQETLQDTISYLRENFLGEGIFS